MQFDSKEILSRMGFDEDFQDIKIEVPELVFYLTSIHPDVAEMALGKIGRSLITFINKIDLKHPDIPHVINQIFYDDLTFRKQVQELLELADRYKHLSISVNFHKLVDNKLSKVFLQDKYGARLFKSNKDRQLIRNQKHMQIVDLKAICNKGSEYWNRQKASFSIYARYNMPYFEDIESYEEQSKIYAELGCQSITKKITNEIKQLKIAINERYYGFNRVTVAKASLILAKMHSYRFRTAWDIHDNKTNSIVIPTSVFSNFEFPDNTQEFSSGAYGYEPRAYPLNKMMHIISDDMRKLVEHLDSFPAMNGKTLFDDYVILVPGIKLGTDAKEESMKYLDTVLIQRQKIHPVLLGERDNKCYFICYF